MQTTRNAQRCIYEDYVRLCGEYLILNREAASLVSLLEADEERHEMAVILETVDRCIESMQQLLTEWHPELNCPMLREQTYSLFDEQPAEHVCYEHRETCKWLKCK